MKPLTKEQADAVRKRIQPVQVFLHELIRRLRDRGFSDDDPVYRAAMKTSDALQELGVAVNYASCDGGVG